MKDTYSRYCENVTNHQETTDQIEEELQKFMQEIGIECWVICYVELSKESRFFIGVQIDDFINLKCSTKNFNKPTMNELYTKILWEFWTPDKYSLKMELNKILKYYKWNWIH